MAGGFSKNAEKNRQFFAAHGIRPESRTANAIDLGAGCGFQAVPLAETGFRVTAVDFCRLMLDELERRAAGHTIAIAEGDIMDFPLWGGRRPLLITCMGDTITHLPGFASVHDLIRQGFAQLAPGGRLVLSFRDYSREPDGEIIVIPVRRDAERIFLCRLSFEAGSVLVTDVVYDHRVGTWTRSVSEYRKLRLDPLRVREVLEDAGFAIEFCGREEGMIVVIGRKV